MYEIKPSTEKFEFKLGKKVYSLPKFNQLKAKDALKLSRIKDDEEAAEVVANIIEREVPGLLDKLTADQLNDLVTAWCEDSGVKLGE